MSDTFAAALWVLDYMFILASYGCSGVNMETGVNQLGFISSYSPIGDDEHGSYSARPEYYGMLAFALAGKGHMLSVENTGSSSLVKAYATRREDGSLGLTMINKTENNIAFEMNIDHRLLPAGRGSMQASLMQLRAPAINAKSGITVGGSEVTTTGEWAPSMTAPVQVKHGRVQLTVPAYSASIVSIGRHRSESVR